MRPSISVRAGLEGLRAYELAAELGDRVLAATRAWNLFEQSVLGRQLARSALSVGANIAEAQGRGHKPDQRRFLLIARGSLMETRHWLARAQRAGLLDDELESLVDETGRVLNGLIGRSEQAPIPKG